MGRFIGGRFGNVVPIAPGTDAPSAVYTLLDQYYSKQDGGWVQPNGMTATGGVVSDYVDPGSGNVYRAHVYTSTGTFDVTQPGTFGDTVGFLVLGGGGGGGGAGPSSVSNGGGGGAGGYRTTMPEGSGGGGPSESELPVSSGQSYTVTVGAGGAGGALGNNNGTQGGESFIGPPGGKLAPALGGGYGANGAMAKLAVLVDLVVVDLYQSTGGAGTPNQGYPGGSTDPGYVSGGGSREGAGVAGETSGNGGNGLSEITGTSVTQLVVEGEDLTPHLLQLVDQEAVVLVVLREV